MPLPLYLQEKRPRYPMDRGLDEPQSPSGKRGENSWPYRGSKSDLSVVQPVASGYTHYSIPAPNSMGTEGYAAEASADNWLSSSAKIKHSGSFTSTMVQRVFVLFIYILFNYALNSSDLLHI
jgi:hypothetical protein